MPSSINCMFYREEIPGIGKNICLPKFDTCTPVDCEDKEPNIEVEQLRKSEE